MGYIGTFPANTTTVMGLPIGKINDLNNRVTALENKSSGSGFQAPLTGGLSGTNTWATAPNVIVVDQGRAMQKVSTDGTVNWVGTTTTTLTIAPTFDIYATA